MSIVGTWEQVGDRIVQSYLAELVIRDLSSSIRQAEHPEKDLLLRTISFGEIWFQATTASVGKEGDPTVWTIYEKGSDEWEFRPLHNMSGGVVSPSHTGAPIFLEVDHSIIDEALALLVYGEIMDLLEVKLDPLPLDRIQEMIDDMKVGDSNRYAEDRAERIDRIREQLDGE